MVATPRVPPLPLFLPPLDLLTHMSRVTRWTRVTLVALAAPLAVLPLLVSATGLAWPGLVCSWAGPGLAWTRCRLARSSLLNTLLHLSQPYFMLCHFRCIFFALFCRLPSPFAFPSIFSPSHRFTAFVLCSFPLFPVKTLAAGSEQEEQCRSCSTHTHAHAHKLSERENVHMLCL